jgi:hypothetical protein
MDEVGPRRDQVGVIEPGTVDTELSSHVRDGLHGVELLRPSDIVGEQNRWSGLIHQSCTVPSVSRFTGRYAGE